MYTGNLKKVHREFINFDFGLKYNEIRTTFITRERIFAPLSTWKGSFNSLFPTHRVFNCLFLKIRGLCYQGSQGEKVGNRAVPEQPLPVSARRWGWRMERGDPQGESSDLGRQAWALVLTPQVQCHLSWETEHLASEIYFSHWTWEGWAWWHGGRFHADAPWCSAQTSHALCAQGPHSQSVGSAGEFVACVSPAQSVQQVASAAFTESSMGLSFVLNIMAVWPLKWINPNTEALLSVRDQEVSGSKDSKELSLS